MYMYLNAFLALLNCLSEIYYKYYDGEEWHDRIFIKLCITVLNNVCTDRIDLLNGKLLL